MARKVRRSAFNDVGTTFGAKNARALEGATGRRRQRYLAKAAAAATRAARSTSDCSLMLVQCVHDTAYPVTL
jgi:hypothetical protein